MNRPTYEALTKNPELMQAVLQQARRERAEAVYRLIIVPIKNLFASGKPAAHRRKLGAAV